MDFNFQSNMSLPKPYYQDDHCTIYHGDCRDIITHLEPVDLVLTDPPYGINYQPNYKTYAGQRNTFSPIRNDDGSLDLGFLFNYGKEQIIFGAENFGGFPHRGRWICWFKRSWRTKANSMPSGDFELAWMSKRSGFYKFFQVIHGGAVNANSESGANNDPRFHPTEKPIPLLRSCIELFSDSNTILDPFMGSGTTLRAAKDLGRKAIGIEIEEKYCEIAVKRLRQEVLPLMERA